MAEPKVTRHGDRIEIGNDQVRVEKGPQLRRAKATEAILADDKTAPHYQLGARDSFGKVIEEGKEFAYLDVFGDPVWYLFEKVELAEDDPRYQHQIAPEDAGLNEDTTNVVAYQYVFEERGVFDTEQQAIAAGLALIGKGS